MIDLRGTAQGTIEEGIKAARIFVPTGQIATLEARGQGNTVHRAEKGDGTVTLPVVILSTAGTSGPAEVFAAALIDHKKATLIGERTLGRAGVQKLVKLPDGSGLWMTWARYLSPTGVVIHGTGPDSVGRSGGAGRRIRRCAEVGPDSRQGPGTGRDRRPPRRRLSPAGRRAEQTGARLTPRNSPWYTGRSRKGLCAWSRRVAQGLERLLDTQEVGGSIPPVPTKSQQARKTSGVAAC